MNSSGGEGCSSNTDNAARKRCGLGEHRQPFAQRAVADLVVVLEKIDKGQGRQMRDSARRARFPFRCGDGSPW